MSIKMYTLEDLDQYQPYSLDYNNKNLILGDILFGLEKLHNNKCHEYHKIAQNWMFKFSDEIALMNENSFYKDTSDKLIENNLFDSLFLDEMIHFDKNLRQFIIK